MPTIVANFVSSISTKKTGDFASKMWASYTQLNPGVYSEAIATEFKRRMKPDYVDSAGTGYYYNTFGPSGLNKTTADWIGIMVTSSATTARTNTKTGATLKWNLDGTIITQNNLPAYTKGANAGIITFTSTDGFSGVTTFDCNTCTLSHLSGLYGFTNLATFQCYSNQLTSLTTYAWTNLVTLYCHSNQLTSLTTYAWTNLVTLYCHSNQLTSLTTYAWTNLSNFQCHSNQLTSLTTYAWTNLTYFYCSSNQLTSLTTYAWTNLVAFQCNGNQLTSLTTYAWTNLVTLYCHSNQLTSLTNFGTNKISVDSELGNYYTTAMVNSRLAYYNTVFASTPPIKNLTLNLSGATMGIPTGAGSNTDLLGILAKFTAAGFTATIIVRTS